MSANNTPVSELLGISIEKIKEMADVKVTLPMRGKIESLNAAVAAAILMYEAVRGKER